MKEGLGRCVVRDRMSSAKHDCERTARATQPRGCSVPGTVTWLWVGEEVSGPIWATDYKSQRCEVDASGGGRVSSSRNWIRRGLDWTERHFAAQSEKSGRFVLNLPSTRAKDSVEHDGVERVERR